MYEEFIKIDRNDRKGWRIIQFDSVSEFVTFENVRSCREVRRDSVECKFSDGSNLASWFGCLNRDEYERTLSYGDERYVDMVYEKEIKSIPPQRIKRGKMRGEYGDELDVHSLNSGNFSHAWTRLTPKVRVGSKNVRLLINGCVAAFVQAKELQWIGVAALRVANALQEAGYNVAIDMMYGSRDVSDKESVCLLIPVKFYEAPLDIMSLSSIVCFPGFFRGPGFINFGRALGTISSGLGIVMSTEEMRRDVIPKYYTDPSEIIEVICNNTTSSESAEKEVERILSKYRGKKDEEKDEEEILIKTVQGAFMAKKDYDELPF